MNLATIRAEVKAALNRRDCTDTLANQFIRDGISRINQEVRIREMETTADASEHVSGGYRTITLPADYLEPIRVLADDNEDEVPLTTYGNLLRLDAQVGTTQAYAIRAGTLYARPYASSSLALDYYSKVGSLSSDTDTNVILDNYPELLRMAALVYAGEHFRMMEQVALWDAHYQALRDSLNQKAQDAEYSGGTMQVQPMGGGYA